MRSSPVAIVLALAALALAPGAAERVLGSTPPDASAAAAASTFSALAGAEAADRSVQVLQFYPAALIANVGDTIVWTNPTGELHTVTFLAPGQARPRFSRQDPLQEYAQGNGQIDGSSYLNSGVLEAGQSWSATAVQEGTYGYICLLHREMNGTLEVHAADALYPTPVDAATAARAAQPIIAHWQAEAAAVQPRVNVRGDGTREYVISGGLGDGVGAVMRFTPGTLQIQAGDTVTWDNADSETPHTATFGPVQGAPDTPWGNPRAFSSGDGVSSGYFGKAWPLGETFSVTFTAPGDFPYVCILHANQGMFGIVSVRAR